MVLGPVVLGIGMLAGHLPAGLLLGHGFRLTLSTVRSAVGLTRSSADHRADRRSGGGG